jgi:hypothetical protein
MLDHIIESAKTQQKNILIISSPRSGTHALGSEISALLGCDNLGEICMVGYCDNPWTDIDRLVNKNKLTVAHLVQLTPKIILAEDVDRIKKSNVVVNIKRRDKVKQFASWMYFRVLDPTGLYGWHNHTTNKTKLKPGDIEAQETDITQFKLEQLIDDYFLPDFKLCYEDLTFNNQKSWRRNEFAFPLPEMFSNIDYVKKHLESWQYAPGHFANEQ